MTTQNLVAFIANHGIEAFINTDGKIYAWAQYSYNGQAYERLERIEPNLAAVREWLGY